MLKVEDCIVEINRIIELYRSRWTLADYPWDDVAQDIRMHIFKKWHLYDQTKPLAPWIASVTQAQMKNTLRNKYYIYQPPCLKCEMYLGEKQCQLYKSDLHKCKLYAKFEDKKGIAANLYFPVSYESSNYDATQQFSCSSTEFANGISNILSGVHKQIFNLFYNSGFSTTKIARQIKVSGYAFKDKMEFVEESLEGAKELAKMLIDEKRISMGLDYGNA